MSIQICPGCQGRNSPQAEVCEWCGRPFVGRARGFGLSWWHVVTALLLGIVVLAAASLAILNASRLDVRPKVVPSPAPAAEATALPTRAATAVLTLATPKPASSPVAGGTPIPPPSPSPTPVPPARYVRVANTGGSGVFMREEPGTQSQRVQPAIAEGSLLRLLGPEETVQAQVWRLCEHEGRSIQGWVPAQYLQAVDVTPTPVRP